VDAISEPIPSYILAGGRSSRFGSDKARALLDGEPLLCRVARSLGDRPVTVVATSPGAYEDLGLRTIADPRPGLGPLGGLEAALRDRGAGWILLAACDLLGLDPRWLADLERARGEAPAVAFRGGHWEPMPALYHTDLLEAVQARLALEPRARALHALLEAEGAASLRVPGGWRSVRSINTREDLGR